MGRAAVAKGPAPAILRAQETVIRWGEMLPPAHPQVQMVDRIAAAAKEARELAKKGNINCLRLDLELPSRR